MPRYFYQHIYMPMLYCVVSLPPSLLPSFPLTPLPPPPPSLV